MKNLIITVIIILGLIVPSSFLMIIVIIFNSDKIGPDINFGKFSDKENASRILKWNLRRCKDINYTGHEYGEGTLTVKCSNGKAYLLSVDVEEQDILPAVYTWNVEELDPNTLERK